MNEVDRNNKMVLMIIFLIIKGNQFISFYPLCYLSNPILAPLTYTLGYLIGRSFDKLWVNKNKQWLILCQ